jgi:mono/diheme cytochrome c family protein
MAGAARRRWPTAVVPGRWRLTRLTRLTRPTPPPKSLLAPLLVLVIGPVMGLTPTAHAERPSRDMVLGRMVGAPPDAPSQALTTHAAARYRLHCAGCHGIDGSGVPSAGVPDLRGVGGFLRLEGGRAFVLRVPGVMASGLDDAGVASVLNWVMNTLARPSLPPETPAFQASEVEAARAAPLVDVMTERARLLQMAQRQGVRLY